MLEEVTKPWLCGVVVGGELELEFHAWKKRVVFVKAKRVLLQGMIGSTCTQLRTIRCSFGRPGFEVCLFVWFLRISRPAGSTRFGKPKTETSKLCLKLSCFCFCFFCLLLTTMLCLHKWKVRISNRYCLDLTFFTSTLENDVLFNSIYWFLFTLTLWF